MKATKEPVLEESKIKITKNEWYILAFLFFIILGIHTYFSKNMTLPIILDDEFGFLANAAFFAGYDWSSIVSGIPYYGFGYSLLIYPFFKLFEDPLIIYKAVVVFNGFTVSIVVIISYYLSKIIIPEMKKTDRFLVSFVISLYPSYLVYSNLAWSESLFVLLFWLLTLCFFRLINENKAPIFFVLVGVLLGYLYMVHPRALGVVLSAMFVLIMARKLQVITIKQFLFFTIGFLLTFLLEVLFKNFMITNLWLNGIKSTTNTPSGSIHKLGELLTAQGIGGYLQTVIGHLFYLGSASYLLAYIGLFACLIIIFNYIVNKLNPLANNMVENNIKNLDQKFFGSLFIFVTFILTFAISTLSLYGGDRADHILYGRYMEGIIGPLILIGMLFLVQKSSIKNKLYFFSVFFYIIIGLFCLVFIQVELLERENIYLISISGIFQFRTVEWNFDIFNLLVSVFIITIIILLLSYRFSKIPLFLIGLLFMWCSLNNLNYQLEPAAKGKLQFLELPKIIKSHDIDTPIYFISHSEMDTTKYLSREHYQYILLNKKINWINKEDIRSLEKLENHRNGGGYVITDIKDLDEYVKGSKVIYKDQLGNYLWIFPGDLQMELEEKGINLFDDVEMLGVDNSEETLEAYHSDIRILEGSENITIINGKNEIISNVSKYTVFKWVSHFSDKVKIQVTNESNIIWPENVSIGIFWVNPKDPSKWLTDYRVSIPKQLYPGDSIILDVPLYKKDLMYDNYMVYIGLVHEGITWFFSEGDDLLELHVSIE